jgi:rhomboid family GlyGly-CTERM serine protease
MWAQLRRSSDWSFVCLHFMVVIVFQLIGIEYFRFESDWPSTGEVWRLVTAHWVHVGWIHLLVNTLGLAICVGLTRPNWSIKRWVIQSICIAFGISILCTLQNPALSWYVGFSGVLYGLYFLAAYDLYSRDRLIAGLIAGAVVVKIVIEQYTSYDLTSEDLIGAPVIVDAHLYGLLMAIAIALVWATYTMNHSPTRQSD